MLNPRLGVLGYEELNAWCAHCFALFWSKGRLAIRAGSWRRYGIGEYTLMFDIPSMLSLLASGNVCARLRGDYFSKFLAVRFKEDRALHLRSRFAL